MATTPSLPSPSSSPPLPQPQQHQQPPQQQQQQQQQQPTHEPNTGPAAIIATNTNSSNNDNINSNKVSVACQTDPNLIDKLVDNHIRRQLDEVDLYQDYVRSAQCTQFWPLDKNPIRLLVPTMLKVDLPEQHLKNESLMFDLVQAITTNSKLVNLLAKYIHHIVPNVIISKRIDLIPLITCTIRVCPDIKEQERLISLLFNLIKRPNEEQRRMILSGIIVVLQVSPHQNSSLLLPNLWDHVSDKFPERRILLAESCATLAHYVRPIMRTNLVLSILIQLLKDKNAAVRSAACKSFACLLTLIMDRNDEVFDACLSATEDIIQDMLQQTPVSFCEHRFELEQMRFCILETIYPLISMWAVKLDRFKVEVAEFYLAKADKYFANLLNGNTTNSSGQNNSQGSFGVPPNNCTSAFESHVNQTITGSALASLSQQNQQQQQPSRASLAAAAVSKRRSMFLESRLASSFSSSSSSSGLGSSSGSSSLSSPSSTPSSTGGNIITSSANMLRRQSAYVTLGPTTSESSTATSSAMLSSQRAINAYLKMLSYLVPFVFSDAVHSCAWLTKSKLHLPSAASENNLSGNPSGRYRDPNNNNNGGNQCGRSSPSSASLYEFTNEINSGLGGGDATTREFSLKAGHGDKLSFVNKLLEPTMIVDESAIVAFHDQLKQEHMTIDSVSWLLDKFLPKFLNVLTHFSHKKFYLVAAAGNSNDAAAHEFLTTTIGSVRQLCLLFGKHLAHSKLRLLIKKHVTSVPALFFLYIASLTAFEPIEQQEYEEILASVKQNLSMPELTRSHVEITAISVKILATNSEQIHSPSTRQKFLTYVLDALVNYSNQIKLSSQSKEFMLIMFRHILTCLIDPQLRPSEWAQILVTKFLPLLIMLANDSSDVYVCTYARLMCAQLVETFDNHLSCPKLTQQTASSIMPALNSLKSLTEQIKASNLKRQIDCLTSNLNEKFFKHQQQAATTTATTTTTVGPEARTPPAATVGGASVVEQKQ